MRIEPSASSAGCNAAHKPPKTIKRPIPRTEQIKKKKNLAQNFLNLRPAKTEIKNGMIMDTKAASQTPFPHTIPFSLKRHGWLRVVRVIPCRFARSAKNYFPSGFRIFTSSAWMYSLPQITLPVFSGSSLPSMPLTVPPASRTMICPAAMSHGCRLRSQ